MLRTLKDQVMLNLEDARATVKYFQNLEGNSARGEVIHAQGQVMALNFVLYQINKRIEN